MFGLRVCLATALLPALRVCAKITSGFGGSATGPDARPEGGSVSPEILPEYLRNMLFLRSSQSTSEAEEREAWSTCLVS